MSEIEPGMRKVIEEKVLQIEKDFDVKIILAIESGSRAWGFESIDSDYDVRFIYKHELKWYLNVLPKRDVIELPIVGSDDYSGWDIRKALF
ncbi:MAG: nucleotidyltransferase, partial [Desulfobacteraceae bacterium IS3]